MTIALEVARSPSTFNPKGNIRQPVYLKDMLVKQSLPSFRMEYLQPYPNSSEPKASPLALLAATCSSIGKTEPERPKESEDVKLEASTTPPRPKDTKYETFKPYENIKRESESPVKTRYPLILHAPTKLHERRSPTYQRTSPVPSPLHPDCVQCKTSRSNSTSPHHHHHPPHVPTTLKSASRPCLCPMCVPPPAVYKPYAAGRCRDPGCVNCLKSAAHPPPPPPPHHSYVHPGLIPHCSHAPTPYASHSGPHSGFKPFKVYSKPSTPYICNWVAEGRHCGCGFATSEELFQHLKTHTSAQQQHQHSCDAYLKASAPPVSPPSSSQVCTIEGCRCKKSLKKPLDPVCDYYRGSARHRYAPYGPPPPVIGSRSAYHPYS